MEKFDILGITMDEMGVINLGLCLVILDPDMSLEAKEIAAEMETIMHAYFFGPENKDE